MQSLKNLKNKPQITNVLRTGILNIVIVEGDFIHQCR